jgi:hypothetical protein
MTRTGSARPSSRTRNRPGVLTRRVPQQRIIDAVNPLVRALARSRAHVLLDRSTLVLHVTGRHSGRCYDIPVNYVDIGGELIILTQHRWRRNLRGDADVEVTYEGQRQPMHAVLDEAPESVARILATFVDRLGWAATRRRTGLRSPDGLPPTVAELQDLAGTTDLAAITLTPVPVPVPVPATTARPGSRSHPQ